MPIVTERQPPLSAESTDSDRLVNWSSGKLVAVGVLLIFCPFVAYADESTISWFKGSSPLMVIYHSLTGATAMYVGILALVVFGAKQVLQGDFGGFFLQATYMILAVSILINIPTVMDFLLGTEP